MQIRQGLRRAAGLALMLVITALACSPTLRALANVPGRIRLTAEDVGRFDLHLPPGATAVASRPGVLAVDGADPGLAAAHLAAGQPFSLSSLAVGEAALELRLFGLLPLRRVAVEVVAPLRLVPGGHSIGVLLRSRGVLVVGYATVRDAEGQVRQPGRAAGIEPGDAIVSIAGQAVTSEEQVGELIQRLAEAGGSLSVEVRRRGHLAVHQISPVRDSVGRWRLGLYIRDGAAGVGTLTFFDPATRRYGALGHVIAEAHTGQAIDVREGQIVAASIASIDKGQPGAPGEKVGVFVDNERSLGSIDRNTRFGIFGNMRQGVENPFFPQPIPVGLSAMVYEGPAEIITVTRGQRLERYQIRILRVVHAAQPDGKNLVIKITDPRLLSETRGIVQGMSGSPIIQDGRLIGAVTHVFVNDPSRGYGVLMEQMLTEAGLLTPAA